MGRFVIVLVLISPGAALGQSGDLARQARKVFETHCYRCHGKDGSRSGRFGHALDVRKMTETGELVPGKPAASRVFARVTDKEDPMPPLDVKEKLKSAEIDILRRWIEAGAPDFQEPQDPPRVKRKPVELVDTYQAMHDHLMKHKQTGSAHFQRFFTLTHLHNNNQITDSQMRLYRAGLAKMLNSLSWDRTIVYPQPIDPQGTILAFDLRDLDWDLNYNWVKIVGFDPGDNKKPRPLTVGPHQGYPYGLRHDESPKDRRLNDLAKKVYQMSGTDLPAVRADWFLAAASLPPLYHELLEIPQHVAELEQKLNVNVRDNYQRDKLVRVGFVKSNVSTQNRLVERHAARYGMYWKSYDFKLKDGPANLLRFPLGPADLFPKGRHPFADQAFVHDGGEMIWSLPNGLHAFMLTDGNGARIDFGPTDVVTDERKTTGGPEIYNGLSCMACHKHGVVELPRDDIRGAAREGAGLEKIRRLYPEKKVVDRLLDRDERDYLTALDEILTPYLRVGADKKRDIKDFPEVVSSLASPYLRGTVDVKQAAFELGIDVDKLEKEIAKNATLRDELGLKIWTTGGVLQRQTWESKRDTLSPFQSTASELNLGVPRHSRRILLGIPQAKPPVPRPEPADLP